MCPATSFRVADKIPEKVIYRKAPSKRHAITEHNAYIRNNCYRILQGTAFLGETFCQQTGFVGGVLQAYNHHHNLVIRPDDVWIAIAVQLSFHVNANVHEFRGKFVKPEGTDELAACISGSLDCAPYEEFVEVMIQEIHKNLLDQDIKDFILPNFSTTTPHDVITCGVVLMAALKRAFDIKTFVLCGIPRVTMLGTIEDWIKLQDKVKKLRAYDLVIWADLLDPIVAEFVKSKKGNPDIDFWQKICDWKAGGSGKEFISGWITVFTCFDEEGNWMGDVDDGKSWPVIDLADIAPGIVEVQLVIQESDKEHKAVLFAGHIATEVHDDECTIQPLAGWILALRTEEPTEQ